MSLGDCSVRWRDWEALSVRETKPWPGESMETRSGKVGERETNRKIRGENISETWVCNDTEKLKQNLLSHRSRGWQNWFLLKIRKKSSSLCLSFWYPQILHGLWIASSLCFHIVFFLCLCSDFPSHKDISCVGLGHPNNLGLPDISLVKNLFAMQRPSV